MQGANESQLCEITKAVTTLYEHRPYPALGFFAPFVPLRRDDLPLLQYRAAYASVFGSTKGAVSRPRILVAGCGTFEPVAVAAANPGSEIVAVDLSARALNALRHHLRWRGLLGQVKLLQSSVTELTSSEGRFDYIVGTGLLHHLPDPEKALAFFLQLLHPKGVGRFMVYSLLGRELLYGAKKFAANFGVREPTRFRRFIRLLPKNHPFLWYFHLYADAKTDTGLADGYLHPWDKARDALGWGEVLRNSGWTASAFLHKSNGQPDRAAKYLPFADGWKQLAVLEALGELEENFTFFAGRSSDCRPKGRADEWEWNSALPKKGVFYSKILGRKIRVNTTIDPAMLTEPERLALLRAMFLLPKKVVDEAR